MAGPVSEDLPMSLTGRRFVSVKYPVSCWIRAARTMPMVTAANASTRGSPPCPLTAASVTPSGPAYEDGRWTRTATATRTREITAEMKKPRLMAVVPLRSARRGATAKMPITAVTTPIAGTISGKASPASPKAALPRMSAATSVTAYDSKRSAAMPAQSPTLSPTLSAMVAALRGSSSGMPCSTLPTRSAPTSAALVKMPPPTRMNIAMSAAPSPKPSSTLGASAA